MPINDYPIDSYPINYDPPLGPVPTVVFARAPNLLQVIVTFSMAMDPTSGLDVPANYTIPGTTVALVIVDPSNTFVTLYATLPPSTLELVTVAQTIQNLAHVNLGFPNTASFMTPPGIFLAPVITPETLPGDFCPDDNLPYERLVGDIPEVYKPTINPTMHGILAAIAQGDCAVTCQTQQIKDQLYVTTASGVYLDRLGAGVGVQRPVGVGMQDADYRDLIPVMSYLPKQLRQAIQELLRIWYGDPSVRASVTAGIPEPYSLADGQTVILNLNGNSTFTFQVVASDYNNVAYATAQEVADAINRQALANQVQGRAQTNAENFLNYVNFATGVIGAVGSIRVTGGTAAAAFDFPIATQTINSLPTPAVLYEVNNEQIIVLLPSSPVVVRRGLKGSWFLNANAQGTIHNGYVFDSSAKYSIGGVVTTTTVAIEQGTVESNILVNPLPTTWPPAAGYFLVDYGLATEEGPIKYLLAPNAGNLIIDPAYVFKYSHPVGAIINLVRSLGPAVIDPDGSDYAAYVTGLAIARAALEQLIVAATAVGVVVDFQVQKPTYLWSNPSLDTNDAV